MIEAIYEPTGELCWINMDYAVDAFARGQDVIVYTFDNERGGYRIKKKDFEIWKELWREVKSDTAS